MLSTFQMINYGLPNNGAVLLGIFFAKWSWLLKIQPLQNYSWKITVSGSNTRKMSGGGLELDNGINTSNSFRPIKEDVDSEPGLEDAESSDDVGHENGMSNDYSSCGSASITLTKNKSPPELMPWLRHFRSQILGPILRSAKSIPFRKPVNPVALGIFPIYNQVNFPSYLIISAYCLSKRYLNYVSLLLKR